MLTFNGNFKNLKLRLTSADYYLLSTLPINQQSLKTTVIGYSGCASQENKEVLDLEQVVALCNNHSLFIEVGPRTQMSTLTNKL